MLGVQDWVEKRLAREMDRTGLAEAEMATMRVKFATHLRRLQESTDETEAVHLASKEDMQRQMQARPPSPLPLLRAYLAGDVVGINTVTVNGILMEISLESSLLLSVSKKPVWCCRSCSPMPAR